MEKDHAQQNLIKTDQIQWTLDEVWLMMFNNMGNIVERGNTLDTAEEKATELQESSKLFYIHTLPWYKRWWQQWFCCCCCPPLNKLEGGYKW